MHRHLSSSLNAAAVLSLGLLTGCGTEEFAQAFKRHASTSEPNGAMHAQQAELDQVARTAADARPTEGAGSGYVADLTGDALSTERWQRRQGGCSSVRNACVDGDPALSQLDGNGALVLRTTAATPAKNEEAAIPARYPSLDLVDPQAAFREGCIEVAIDLPKHASTYGGVVLTPSADDDFAGQVWLMSASEGELKLGLGCRHDGGSVVNARPIIDGGDSDSDGGSAADVAATTHTVRLCADANQARWEVDGKLWASFDAAEMPPSCGAWPFGRPQRSLRAHLVVSPVDGMHGEAPADTMVLRALTTAP